MPVDVILHAATQAVGKFCAIRGAIGIGVMRKPQAARDVGTQPVLAVSQHVKPAKLILIDVRVVRSEVFPSQRISRTVRTVVAVPHEFNLRIFRQIESEERAVR